MNTEPQIVVITGASAGVGRATARLFARTGAHIGLLARGEQGLENARKELEASGARAIIIPTDVADPTAVARAAAIVEEKLGPIDIWINNAMTSVFAPLVAIEPEEFRRVTEVTYLGVVYGTMEALKRMQPRNRGTIIQVGSALAYRSIPLQSAYCGSKHAIVGFTDSLRCELIHERSRIKLTLVHMPALNTPQFGWVKSRLRRKSQPVPPIFQPEVAAEAILWAASHPRREIWVGASTYKSILAQRFFPGLLDLYLGKTGYSAQQYDGEEDSNRVDNLWQPVVVDAGAHGSFDDQARRHSWTLGLLQHQKLLLCAGALLAGIIVSLNARNERDRGARS